jgi:hypothetical protein
MNIIEFLEQREILWQPVRFSEAGKRPAAFPDGVRPKVNDFRTCTPAEIRRRQREYWHLTGFIYHDTSVIHVLDCDRDLRAAWDRATRLPYYASVNKNLPHAFVTPVNECLPPCKRIDVGDGIELLKGQASIAAKDATVHNADASLQQLLDLPDSDEVANEGDSDAIPLIAHEFWHEYKSFVALVAAAKNSGVAKDVLERHCPHACPYSLNDKWSQLESSPLRAYTGKTLKWMASRSVPQQFEDWQAVFELYHYKVVSEPIYVYAPSSRSRSLKWVEKSKFVDARAHWGEKFVRRWCKSPSPSNIFMRIDWLPTPLETPKDVFNTHVPFWHENRTLPGWSARTFDGHVIGHRGGVDITEFHQRLVDIAGGRTEWWDYLVGWLGQILIEPAHMPPIVPLLFSHHQGVGKSMVFDQLMSRVLGPEKHECVQGIEHMFPDYWTPRAQGLMCVAEDAEQSKHLMGRIKGETTAMSIKDNEKNGPKIRYHNACRNVLCTNNVNALDVDQDQRRIAVFQHAGLIGAHDTRFNKRMGRLMDNDNALLAFVRYLRENAEPYGSFDWRGNRPNPEVMRSMMRMNDPLIVRFLADHTSNNANERENFTFQTWTSMVHQWAQHQPGNVSERTRTWQKIRADTDKAIATLGEDRVHFQGKSNGHQRQHVIVDVARLQQHFQSLLYYE